MSAATSSWYRIEAEKCLDRAHNAATKDGDFKSATLLTAQAHVYAVLAQSAPKNPPMWQ